MNVGKGKIILVFFFLLSIAVVVLFFWTRTSGEEWKEAEKQTTLDEVSISNLEKSIEYLSRNVGERVEGSKEEKLVAEYLGGVSYGLMELYGYKTESQTFRIDGGGESQNIVAYKNVLFSDTKENVIVGAHYDSTVNSPGAVDNASGVAVLLEVARVIRDVAYDKNIVFVFFGAEETPRNDGSAYFVSNLTEEEKKSISLMINVDTVGMKGDLELHRRQSSFESDAFAKELLAIYEPMKLMPRIVDSDLPTDHKAFEEAGIASVLFFTPGSEATRSSEDGMDKVWAGTNSTGVFGIIHSGEDTMEKVDIELVRDIAIGLVEYVMD